jgi:predicted amidohydrolase
MHKVTSQFNGNACAICNTALAFLNGEEAYRYDKRGNFHEEQNYGADTIFVRGEKSSVSTIEGLGIGFEICLDHNINALPDLVRENANGRLDLHIVASDYVINRKTPDQLIREGGHKTHAATVDTEHGVWQKVAAKLAAVPSFHSEDISTRK